MVKTIIGVMGPGVTAPPALTAIAYDLGYQIGARGWVLLTGGRNAGVMDAASRGARAAGGLTLGILPGATSDGLSTAVDIPVLTGLGHGRNIVNVLSSQVIVACGLGPGTASEVALAIKVGRPVILLSISPADHRFFQGLAEQPIATAETVPSAIRQIAAAVPSEAGEGPASGMISPL